MRQLILCVCASWLGGGCTPTSTDVKPLESGLAAAVSLGHSSSIAMQAMADNSLCASVTASCANYPCNGEVVIALGGGCPLPLGGDASGSINITGSWQSADSATLSSTYVSVKAGTRSDVVVNASNLTVTRAEDSASVRYTWQDVRVLSSATTLSGQSSWTVEVDGAGTPGDPSDDVYTISGADQGVNTQVSQVSASSVVVKPSCRLNPVGGSATVQKVSTLSIVNATVRFHEACDGKADVNGDSVAMEFLR